MLLGRGWSLRRLLVLHRPVLDGRSRLGVERRCRWVRDGGLFGREGWLLSCGLELESGRPFCELGMWVVRSFLMTMPSIMV